jgi:hypothetical protein
VDCQKVGPRRRSMILRPSAATRALVSRQAHPRARGLVKENANKRQGNRVASCGLAVIAFRRCGFFLMVGSEVERVAGLTKQIIADAAALAMRLAKVCAAITAPA